jgi:hypothetical protein
MNIEKKAKTLEFAPGCFDGFEGTQEELDDLMSEIQRMFDSGEMEANSTPVDIDELIEEESEYALKVMQSLNDEEPKRNLQ